MYLYSAMVARVAKKERSKQTMNRIDTFLPVQPPNSTVPQLLTVIPSLLVGILHLLDYGVEGLVASHGNVQLTHKRYQLWPTAECRKRNT